LAAALPLPNTMSHPYLKVNAHQVEIHPWRWDSYQLMWKQAHSVIGARGLHNIFMQKKTQNTLEIITQFGIHYE
jgi:hypothetical protein